MAESKFIFTGNIPKSFDMIRVASLSSSLQIKLGDDTLLFSFGYPYAVETGKVVYFPDVGKKAATTKAINALSPELPHVRLPVSAYDNMVALLLTRAGMQLAAQNA